MINTFNIKEYINFLHLKKYSAPASGELKDRWANVPGTELQAQLQGLYEHWGIDRATASLYEQVFLQSQSYNTPNPVPEQPLYQQPQQTPLTQNNIPPKKSYKALSLVLGLALLAAIAGTAYFFIANPKDTGPVSPIDSTQQVKTEKPAVASEQNATEPEPEVDTTVAATPDDEVNIETIKTLLAAEEERNLSNILSTFSPDAQQYWELRNPSYDDLAKRYHSVWSKSSNGKHSNVHIEKVADHTYDMFGDYDFFSLKDQTSKTVKAHVRYVLDDDHRIIKTFGVQ